MTALRRCWRNWSTCPSRVWTQPTPAVYCAPELEPPGRPRRLVTTSGVRKDDLAVLDLDEIDARIALAAFLTRGAGFLEFDLSVHAGQLDLPERRADRLGLRLARLGDRGRDGADAVIAAEALGQTRERIAALLPFVDEGLSHGRIGRDIGVPRREEGDVGGVVCRRTRLLDQLIGVLRAAGGDDALLQAQRRRLLEDQRELLDRRGDDARVGIGGLDLGELGAHVLSRRIHGLDQAHLDIVLLEHLAEVFR